MTGSNANGLARLRRSEWPAVFAVWAVLLQLVFLAVHIGAQAGPARADALAHGHVRLCLPSAEQGDAGGESSAPPQTGAVCPVCAASACQATLVAPIVPAVASPVRVARIEARVVIYVAPSRVVLRSGSARGPPSFLAS